MILVCGATGDLGGRIVRGLQAAGEPVRALVRSGAADLDVERVTGDFRDPGSLQRAVAGVKTVVSTVTVMSRALAGEKGADFQRVDVAGHRALIAAAEAAGAERFVFVSAAGVNWMAATPLGAAKLAIEQALAGSTLREVVLRPDQFQEVWLSPTAQFDWPARKVVIFGKGETAVRYVGADDVAALAVRLALADDPPRLVEFGGPDAISRKRAVEIFERALGEPFRRRHVPRAAMRIGAVALRRPKPALASIMGAALAADLHAPTWDAAPLTDLGIQPRSVEAYARAVAA
ncbi:MAG TPA: NAD(P)H-binding protein [Solirubrobacter sp.]|nr:NAD(P)H-binding protein [Solirubrobacter sp.]